MNVKMYVSLSCLCSVYNSTAENQNKCNNFTLKMKYDSILSFRGSSRLALSYMRKASNLHRYSGLNKYWDSDILFGFFGPVLQHVGVKMQH